MSQSVDFLWSHRSSGVPISGPEFPEVLRVPSVGAVGEGEEGCFQPGWKGGTARILGLKSATWPLGVRVAVCPEGHEDAGGGEPFLIRLRRGSELKEAGGAERTRTRLKMGFSGCLRFEQDSQHVGREPRLWLWYSPSQRPCHLSLRQSVHSEHRASAL